MPGSESAPLEVDLRALAAICARYGIAELLVFGSVARGDDQPDSDIDLLYRLTPGAQLGWEINRLDDELQALFGRAVDLVSITSLHPRLRDNVTTEARHLYAA